MSSAASTTKAADLVSFQEIDHNDLLQVRKAQEALLKEQFIRLQALKTCRRALSLCYKHHGVNHYENCKELAEKYLDMLPDHRVKGYLFYQRNDISK